MQEEMEEEDSMSEIFRFDSVSVWPNPEAQDEGENVYEAETENMDGVIELHCYFGCSHKPGFHMIARIASDATITENSDLRFLQSLRLTGNYF